MVDDCGEILSFSITPGDFDEQVTSLSGTLYDKAIGEVVVPPQLSSSLAIIAE
jgi:hypothetical protein